MPRGEGAGGGAVSISQPNGLFNDVNIEFGWAGFAAARRRKQRSERLWNQSGSHSTTSATSCVTAWHSASSIGTVTGSKSVVCPLAVP